MFATLQKIGRALMLPIAVLPAAGLLARLGQDDMLTALFTSMGYPVSFAWMGNAGTIILDNLPLLFAIGVAVGFTPDVGTAGMSAAVGYWVFSRVVVDISKAVYGPAGEKVNMGVLGGILMGLLAAHVYERYHKTKLPAWLAFFGGKRFVPMLTALSALVLGLFFGLVWYWPGQLLTSVANWATTHGPIGAAVHIFFNRLLLPTGLHHVINSIVWFQFGDLTSFVPSKGAQGGIFMTGFFPIMMFGLPAAALAMYTTAKPENKTAVGGMFLSAAVTSFVTGVTEPIEFAFMFVAPVLYIVHALLATVSAYVTVALGIRSGFSFSAGFIDYALNYKISTHPEWLFLIGLGFGVVYYFLFVVLIKAMNIPTPGREPDVVE
jgi:N-acetylglucosamine PTS system EIICBA or EIICB component